MLTLPIKKKWFDMILSGEKKEEYREIKDYYTTRFFNALDGEYFKDKKVHLKYSSKFLKHGYCYQNIVFPVMFRNGYSATSPSFIAQVSLDIGKGKKEWGAEAGKEYFRLYIHNIKSVKL